MISLILRNRLVFGPPLWTAVIRPLKGLDKTAQLYALAKEYTPELCGKMSALDPTGAAVAFVKAFSARWFPIQVAHQSWGNEGPNINRLVSSIPVTNRTFEEWQYEGWNRPDGQLLAGIIVQKPPRLTGSRIVVIDRFKTKLGDAVAEPLVGLLPETGLSLAAAVRKLKGSPWPGLADRCRWLYSRTGNIWLDGWDRNRDLAWNRKMVEQLSGDWPACIETEKRIKDFDEWVSKDFTARCTEVIHFITGGNHE